MSLALTAPSILVLFIVELLMGITLLKEYSFNLFMTIEIMAPAGSFEALSAAIKAGAGSVYFGVGKLNMRSRSANFSVDDLPKIVKICKDANVKSYLTLNTIMYDQDLVNMRKLCDRAKIEKVDAIIASDISVIEYANSINLEVHISTQCNVSNISAVKFYSKYADVIVLARELSLMQINKISKDIKEQKIRGPRGNLIRLEAFVHGALCIAISGKCYMSLAQYNSSANRGACLQACRRSYSVKDNETGDQLMIDNEFVMSPRDLCTIGQLDKLIKSGVEVLKIEGRGRGPEYVFTAVKCYREATELILRNDGSYNFERILDFRKELNSVFNRGFWEGGYYLRKKTEEWSGVYGSKATKRKVTIGTITNYYSRNKVGELLVETNELKIGDEVIITGPTTGFVKFILTEMKVSETYDSEGLQADSKTISKKGNYVTFPCSEKLRKNDKVFVLKNNSID